MRLVARWRIAAVWAVLVCAVLLPFFLFEQDVRSLVDASLAAAGSNRFLVAMVLFAVLASDILMPVPSCLASALCGALLGPWIGFAVSFSAMCVSAVAGYLLGRFGAELARRSVRGFSSALDASADGRGAMLIFLMRPVPVLAECSVVYAGLRRWPLGACAFWCLVGNALVSAVYAVLGHLGRTSDSPLPAFAAVILLSALAFACGRMWRGKSTHSS